MIIQPVRDALDYYRRLNEATQPPRHRKSTDVTALQSVHPPASHPPALGTTSNNSSNDNNNASCDKVPSSETPAAAENVPTAASSTGVSISEDEPEQQITTSIQSNTPPPSPKIKVPPVSSPDGTAPVSLPEVDSVPPIPNVQPMGHRNSNPLTYRRASQLLMLKASGSSNSLKVANLLPMRSNTGGSNFQSFPSVESESDRDGDNDDDGVSEDETMTEVAVSEKALKFKIATEPSFDFSTSRKGSRENKSDQSSGQSTVVTTKGDDRISFDTCFSSATRVDFIPTTASLGIAGASPGKHHHHHHLPSGKATTASVGGGSSVSSGGGKGVKSKDSFFSRLKLFTERLSISADSTTSGGSGCESPPPGSTAGCKHHGINYFRRHGRKDSKRSKSKDAGGAVGGSSEKYHAKHRGSSSDPEGHLTSDDKLSGEGSENVVRGSGGGGSELVSPDCSPALSGASGTEHRRSSWKHCSGSLDSVLSKDEHAKRSPSKRLVLPRFSSFVQKKTRMGFMMRRSSPKGSSPNTNEPQS